MSGKRITIGNRPGVLSLVCSDDWQQLVVVEKITTGRMSVQNTPSYMYVTAQIEQGLNFWPVTRPGLFDPVIRLSRFDRSSVCVENSSGNHDWLLANASACVSCGFRLRNVSDCVWMETGLKVQEKSTSRGNQETRTTQQVINPGYTHELPRSHAWWLIIY